VRSSTVNTFSLVSLSPVFAGIVLVSRRGAVSAAFLSCADPSRVAGSMALKAPCHHTVAMENLGFMYDALQDQALLDNQVCLLRGCYIDNKGYCLLPSVRVSGALTHVEKINNTT